MKSRGKLKIEGENIDYIQLADNGENLLSMAQLTKLGFTAIFKDSQLILIPPMNTLSKNVQEKLRLASRDWKNHGIIIEEENGLYHVCIKKHGKITNPRNRNVYADNLATDKITKVGMVDVHNLDLTMDKPPINKVFLLHCVLGHISVENLKRFKLKITKEDEHHIRTCVTCLSVKHKTKPTTKLRDREGDKVFQHLHIDTAGPYRRGDKTWYIVVVIDQYSRFMNTFVVNNKSDISTLLSDWLRDRHQELGWKPEKITTDQGSEFGHFDYVLQKGVDRLGIPIYANVRVNTAPTGYKQWNGIAERGVQTIKILQKLVTSSEEKFFKESVEYATMIYNFTPHSTIGFEQPYGRYYERKSGRTQDLNDEDRFAKFMFIDSQPARLNNGTEFTLPEFPMFLQDVIYFLDPEETKTAYEGYFTGYSKDFKVIVNDRPLARHLPGFYYGIADSVSFTAGPPPTVTRPFKARGRIRAIPFLNSSFQLHPTSHIPFQHSRPSRIGDPYSNSIRTLQGLF